MERKPPHCVSSPSRVLYSTITPLFEVGIIFGPILAIRCGCEDHCAAALRMSSDCCELHTVRSPERWSARGAGSSAPTPGRTGARLPLGAQRQRNFGNVVI